MVETYKHNGFEYRLAEWLAGVKRLWYIEKIIKWWVEWIMWWRFADGADNIRWY